MDNKPIDKHKNYTSCEQREIAIKKNEMEQFLISNVSQNIFKK